MPRERGMPGMYANAVPLGAYGSPYSRPLLSGQQQIPKLLSSKWVLLYIFPSLKNIAVWFWSVALLQISGFKNSSSSCRRYILTALMFFCRWTFRQYFFIHFFFKNFKWLYSDIRSDLVSLHGEVLNFEHFTSVDWKCLILLHLMFVMEIDPAKKQIPFPPSPLAT